MQKKMQKTLRIFVVAVRRVVADIYVQICHHSVLLELRSADLHADRGHAVAVNKRGFRTLRTDKIWYLVLFFNALNSGLSGSAEI